MHGSDVSLETQIAFSVALAPAQKKVEYREKLQRVLHDQQTGLLQPPHDHPADTRSTRFSFGGCST